MTRWTSLGHRGDHTEDIINMTNEIYEKHGYALMKKIATPIKVTKIANGKIQEGYYEEKSTVDYVGIIQGTAVCFDAKETNHCSLPLQNIHKHQIEYMQKFRAQGGISFILCYFKRFNDFLLIPLETLERFVAIADDGGRKSIPYSVLNKNFSIRFNEDGTLSYIEKIILYMDCLKDDDFKF